LVVESGSEFPQRDTLIFLSFCVILTTLVVQGLSLPAVIRRLEISPVSANER
jgi:monovalent cation/hydrogen antiporter